MLFSGPTGTNRLGDGCGTQRMDKKRDNKNILEAVKKRESGKSLAVARAARDRIQFKLPLPCFGGPSQ